MYNILLYFTKQPNFLEFGYDYRAFIGYKTVNRFPIASTFYSVIGIFVGSLWTTEPIARETNSFVGKFTYLPIFLFRMLAWQIIIIMLVFFSIYIIACMLCVNWAVFFFSQEKLKLEPVCYACLSLVLPIHKLPSENVENRHWYFWNHSSNHELFVCKFFYMKKYLNLRVYKDFNTFANKYFHKNFRLLELWFELISIL